MSSDIMEKLKAMAGDTIPKTQTKAEKVVRAKSEIAVAKPKVAEQTIDPTPVEEEEEDDRLIRKTAVVVLDDRSTFSDMVGAKVCFVPEGAKELPKGAYEQGISIYDLLILRDAIKAAAR
jgi:hypothetical protein